MRATTRPVKIPKVRIVKADVFIIPYDPVSGRRNSSMSSFWIANWELFENNRW